MANQKLKHVTEFTTQMFLECWQIWASTTSQESFFQCWATLVVKKFFLKSSLSLLQCSFGLFPCVPSALHLILQEFIYTYRYTADFLGYLVSPSTGPKNVKVPSPSQLFMPFCYLCLGILPSLNLKSTSQRKCAMNVITCKELIWKNDR